MLREWRSQCVLGPCLISAVTTVTLLLVPRPSSAGEQVARSPAYSDAWLAPDENPPQGATPFGQSFSYYQVAGATLRGRSSSTQYQYDGVGCSHVTAGAGAGRILNTELVLPDNAIIKYLRVYYYDTSATTGVSGYITRYQPGVASADLVNAGSTAAYSGGYGFVVSDEITETVNNTVYAYTLIGWPGESTVASQICGLRVAYFAPTLFVDGFETGDYLRWSTVMPIAGESVRSSTSTEPPPATPDGR